MLKLQSLLSIVLRVYERFSCLLSLSKFQSLFYLLYWAKDRMVTWAQLLTRKQLGAKTILAPPIYP